MSIKDKLEATGSLSLTSSARAASPIAIAITRSSCVPGRAPVPPSGSRTKLRHSPSSRRLWKHSGRSTSAASSRPSAAGRLIDVVSQPACPPCSIDPSRSRTPSQPAPALRCRGCSAPPPATRRYTPPAKSVTSRANSSPPICPANSAHCNPVSSSSTCAAE